MSTAKGSEVFSSPATTTTKDENANGHDTIHKDNGIRANQIPVRGKPMKRCKLVIVGDGCCGKTSLLTVFKRYKRTSRMKPYLQASYK